MSRMVATTGQSTDARGEPRPGQGNRSGGCRAGTLANGSDSAPEPLSDATTRCDAPAIQGLPDNRQSKCESGNRHGAASLRQASEGFWRVLAYSPGHRDTGVLTATRGTNPPAHGG